MPIADTIASRLRIVAAIAVVAVPLSGCTTDRANLESRDDTYPGVGTLALRFDDSGAKQIGSTTASLEARVVGADRHDIQVHRSLEFTEGDEPEETVEQGDDALTVSARCPDRFTIGNPTCVTFYEITVPYGTVVRGDSRFGNLSVVDTRAEVELHSRYGDVHMTAGADDFALYAVRAISVTGESSVTVPQGASGIPVVLTTEDGNAIATTDGR